MDVSFTLSGVRELVKQFELLPDKMQNRILKKAITRASRLVATAEKDQAPSETGLLKQSLGPTAVKKYGETLFAAIGARRGYRRAVVQTRKGTLRHLGKAASQAAENVSFRNPTKYLHLVEGGRSAITHLMSGEKILYSPVENRFFGRHVAAQPANPFIERAFSTVNDSVMELVKAEVAAGLDEELKQ